MGPKSDHMIWLGGSKGGLRVKLKGDGLGWESPTFMTRHESDIPRSWGGDKRAGGCKLGATDKVIPLTCASGAVTLRPAEPLTFRFDLMITPGECSDGMSDRTYPYTATLLVGDEQRQGCAWTDSQPYDEPELP